MTARPASRPKPQPSPVRDQRRMRLVLWLRILLPLSALAILSTLFLFSRPIDPSAAIPYAELDVNALALKPRVEAPNYAGVTRDGTEVALKAGVVTPDGTDYEARKVSVTLKDRAGVITTILGEAAQVAPDAGLVTFRDGMSLVTSQLYTLTAPVLTAGLRETYAESSGPVQGTGPLGRIDAGSLLLEPTGTKIGGEPQHVLVFKGGVRVVYEPGK